MLRPYGRMTIRINHECGGTWFTHNKRFTYEQVGKFFAHFSDIIHQEAPNVRTVFCAGFAQADGKLEKEDEFAVAYRAADVWSADCYLALHYGWPYDVAEIGGGQYKADSVGMYYDMFRRTYERASSQFGAKPLVTAEFNTDGDVTGPRHQGESVIRFAETFRDHKADWFKAISLYQFRDRGRLGLEIEDPNNPAVGIEQPMLAQYRELLKDPYFQPSMTEMGEATFPAELRWGGAEDADGLAIPLHFEGNPEFCEMTVEQEIGLMVELHGKWFYKAPHVKTIDLMSAFFDAPLDTPADLKLNLFAPPADGVNVEDGHADWMTNYYATLQEAPKMRIRYEVPGVVG